MNLTKEQLQRGGLGLILAIAALFAYFNVLLSPLSKREARAKASIEKLTPQLREAQTQINRTKAIAAGDTNAEAAKAIRESIEAHLPQEAVIVWLPQRVNDLFKAHQITPQSISLRGENPDPDLKPYSRSQWTVSIPDTDYHQFALALAAFENQNGLAQVTHLNLSSTLSKVDKQNIGFTFQTVNRP